MIYRKLLMSAIPFFYTLFQSCQTGENDQANRLALLKTLNNTIDYYRTDERDLMRQLEESITDLKRDNQAYWKEVGEMIDLHAKPAESAIENLRREKNPETDSLESLYTALCQFRDVVLNIDSSLKEDFSNMLKFFPGQKDHLLTNSKEFHRFYFASGNENEIQIQLSKLLCDILDLKKRMLTYCNRKSLPGCDLTFYSQSFLVGVSTEITQPGGKISIYAGLGSFSPNSNAKVWIGGKTIPLNSAYYASKTITAPSKPGTYRTPIVITYFNQVTGKEEVDSSYITYTVKDFLSQ